MSKKITLKDIKSFITAQNMISLIMGSVEQYDSIVLNDICSIK